MTRKVALILVGLGILWPRLCADSGEHPTVLQQFFVMKAFAPNVKTVGVLVSSRVSENFKERLRHASAAVGVKSVISIVSNLHDISGCYEELTKNYRVEFLWIPPDDPVLSGDLARDFLVRKAVVEGVGILAPREDWISKGATLYVGLEGGKVRPLYNERALAVLGLTVPEKYARVATAASE